MPAKTSTSIFELISKSHRILLNLHPSPDGDCAGSALALYWHLINIGKKPTVIKGDSELPLSLKMLPGFDRVKPLNFTEIDLTKFDLFISVDASTPNQITKKTSLVFPLSIPTIVIDHHSTNTKYGQINLIDPKAPSTTQIILELLTNWKSDITKNIASNLFLGLYTDTGGFKYPNTTARTFRYASKLATIYPDFPKLVFELENNNHPQHMKYKGLAYLSIENYFNQNLALSAISNKKLVKHGIESKYTEKSEFSNVLKSVVGWNIGISMVEIEPGVCALSMRTRDPVKFNVAKIATNVGVGGGHPAAAGTTIYASLSKARKMLLDTIQTTYPELGKP